MFLKNLSALELPRGKMSVFKLSRTGKTMKTLLSEMMNGTWASTDVVFKSRLILSTAHLGSADEVFVPGQDCEC